MTPHETFEQDTGTNAAGADPGRPSHIRDLIVSQHAELRFAIADLKARSSDAGATQGGSLDPLRSALRRLIHALHAHLAFEESVLAPALLDTDAWGKVRYEALLAEHLRQRAVLRELLLWIEHAPDRAAIAATANRFCTDLLADMEQEEHGIFSSAVLHDDCIVVEIGA